MLVTERHQDAPAQHTPRVVVVVLLIPSLLPKAVGEEGSKPVAQNSLASVRR